MGSRHANTAFSMRSWISLFITKQTGRRLQASGARDWESRSEEDDLLIIVLR